MFGSIRRCAPIFGLMIGLCVVPTPALPQAVGAVPSDGGGADVLPEWLAGYWVGEGFGGTAEELWTSPRAGTMAGTFRLTITGQVQLFEFMTLTLEDEDPLLRVKHFNRDGSPWEDGGEWVEFPFERMSRGGIYFNGVSYELVDSATMRVRVAVGRAGGSSAVEELLLQRVR